MNRVSCALTAFAFICTAVSSAGEPTGPLVGFAANRTWSDQSGKFKIEGKLKHADGNSLQLLKSDGRVVTVPLDRMSDADRAFIQGFLVAEKAIAHSKESTDDDADNPFAGGEPIASSGKMSTLPSSNGLSGVESLPGVDAAISGIAKRRAIVNGFRPLAITPGREFWEAKPPIAFPEVSFDDATIQTPLTKSFFAGMRVLAAGKSGTVVLNSHQEKRFKDPAGSKFAIANASTLDVSPVYEFDQPWKLLTISADGARVAAVRVEGFDKGNDVAIFKLSDGRLVPEFEFTAGGGSWDELHWAEFLPGNRLVTVSQKHNLTFWDLSNSIGPKAILRGSTGGVTRAEISAAGELIALPFGNSIAVIESTAGKLVGCINRDVPADQLAFSPDGKYLAAFHPFTVTLYGTGDGKPEKTIAVSEGNKAASFRWVGKNLLVGNVLYDAQRSVPMWTYEGNPSSQTTLGDYLIASFGGDKQSSILVVRIPHGEALRTASEIDAATAYAIKPGDSVSVVYDLGTTPANTQKEIQDAVAAKLTSIDWKLDPNASNSIAVKVEQGKQEEAEYFTRTGFGPIPFFPPPGFGGPRPSGPSEKVTYTPWTHTITIRAGDKQVYTSNYVRSAPQNLQSKDNESTQAAVTRVCQPTPSFFSNLSLPPYLLKAEYQGGLGKSKLDASGIK